MNKHAGDFWMHQGLTLLWHAPLLNQLCAPHEVVSVRKWLQAGPDWHPPLPSRQGRALVVAGLDAVLDSLTGHAEAWLGSEFKRQVLQFQQRPREDALVFWLPGGRARVQASPVEERYHIGLQPSGRVALRAVLGGAESTLQRIVAPGTRDADADGAAWHGLHIRRIS